MATISELVRHVSLDDAIKQAKTRLGYELDPLHLGRIMVYLLKLYLIQGGHVSPKER